MIRRMLRQTRRKILRRGLVTAGKLQAMTPATEPAERQIIQPAARIRRGIQIPRMRRTILRTPPMMLRQVRKTTVQMCRITPQTRKNRMVIPQTWILKRTISSARSKSRQGAAERKNRITIRA